MVETVALVDSNAVIKIVSADHTMTDKEETVVDMVVTEADLEAAEEATEVDMVVIEVDSEETEVVTDEDLAMPLSKSSQPPTSTLETCFSMSLPLISRESLLNLERSPNLSLPPMTVG